MSTFSVEHPLSFLLSKQSTHRLYVKDSLSYRYTPLILTKLGFLILAITLSICLAVLSTMLLL